MIFTNIKRVSSDYRKLVLFLLFMYLKYKVIIYAQFVCQYSLVNVSITHL